MDRNRQEEIETCRALIARKEAETRDYRRRLADLSAQEKVGPSDRGRMVLALRRHKAQAAELLRKAAENRRLADRQATHAVDLLRLDRTRLLNLLPRCDAESDEDCPDELQTVETQRFFESFQALQAHVARGDYAAAAASLSD